MNAEAVGGAVAGGGIMAVAVRYVPEIILKAMGREKPNGYVKKEDCEKLHERFQVKNDECIKELRSDIKALLERQGEIHGMLKVAISRKMVDDDTGN